MPSQNIGYHSDVCHVRALHGVCFQQYLTPLKMRRGKHKDHSAQGWRRRHIWQEQRYASSSLLYLWNNCKYQKQYRCHRGYILCIEWSTSLPSPASRPLVLQIAHILLIMILQYQDSTSFFIFNLWLSFSSFFTSAEKNETFWGLVLGLVNNPG